MNYLKLFEDFDKKDYEYAASKTAEYKSEYKLEIFPEIKDILIDLKDEGFVYDAYFCEADGPLEYDMINFNISKNDKSYFYFKEVKEKILHIDSFLKSKDYFLSKEGSYYLTYSNTHVRRNISNNSIGIRDYAFKDIKFKINSIHLNYLIYTPMRSVDEDTGEEFYI